MLSVGFTVYNGYVDDIPDYFAALGKKMPPYTNYADFIIRIATHPSLEELDYSIRGLGRECSKRYQHKTMEDFGVNYNGDLTMICENRQVSFGKQFSVIFNRYFINTLRDPRGIV